MVLPSSLCGSSGALEGRLTSLYKHDLVLKSLCSFCGCLVLRFWFVLAAKTVVVSLDAEPRDGQWDRLEGTTKARLISVQ